jgi:protein subunit release factor A
MTSVIMRNNWLSKQYREKNRNITHPYCVTNKHKSKEQLASECSSLNKKYKYLHNKFEKLKNKIHMAEDLLTDDDKELREMFINLKSGIERINDRINK